MDAPQSKMHSAFLTLRLWIVKRLKLIGTESGIEKLFSDDIESEKNDCLINLLKGGVLYVCQDKQTSDIIMCQSFENDQGFSKIMYFVALFLGGDGTLPVCKYKPISTFCQKTIRLEPPKKCQESGSRNVRHSEH